MRDTETMFISRAKSCSLDIVQSQDDIYGENTTDLYRSKRQYTLHSVPLIIQCTCRDVSCDWMCIGSLNNTMNIQTFENDTVL